MALLITQENIKKRLCFLLKVLQSFSACILLTMFVSHHVLGRGVNVHLVQAVLAAVEREMGSVGTLAEVDLLHRPDQCHTVQNGHPG